jgi:hypothetical protein
VKVSGFDKFKAGSQTVTITLGGKTATFKVTVGPGPFVGTWEGMMFRQFQGEEGEFPVTLIMTDDTWTISYPPYKDGKITGGYDYRGNVYSGTYTRDSNTGRHATLVLKKAEHSEDWAPPAADIISATQLKITGSNIRAKFGEAVIFTKR